MKINIYKNSIKKKIGFIEMENKEKVLEFLKEIGDKNYTFVLEEKKQPIYLR